MGQHRRGNMTETGFTRRTLLALTAGAPATALLGGLGLSPVAAQQNYPNRNVMFVIGFSPGGPSDVLSRIITRRLEQELKQPFVIENRAGAGGSLAAQIVARAPPDGYTLMLGTEAALGVNILLQKGLNYDPDKNFDYVSLIGTQPNIIYVHPDVPIKSFPELLAYAKANPGKLNFASGGLGTTAHLAGELLKIKAGIDMAHVPFKGTGPAVQAVVANHVQIGFSAPSPIIGHIQGGALRPIAVTTVKRSIAFPDLPTVAEHGYPGFELKNWHGLVGPAGMPKDVIETLRRALHASLADPAVQKQMSELGIEPAPTSSEEFRAMVKGEMPMWEDIIKTANIKVE